MTRNLRIFPLQGLFTAIGKDAPAGYASDLLNVRVADGKARPRYGYRNVDAAPSGFEAAYGFEWLSGYDSDKENVEEWVSFEGRSGTVKPYSVHKTTGARTEIKDGTTAQSLHASPWTGFAFSGESFFVNPNNDPGIFKHEIGDATSWTGLTGLDAPVGFTSAFEASAPISYSGATITPSGVASSVTNNGGYFTVKHTASSTGAGGFEVDFGAGTGKDWSINDHFSFHLVTPSINPLFTIDWTTLAVTMTNDDGSPLTFSPTQVAVTPTGSTAAYRITIYFDGKDRDVWDNIRKITFAYQVLTSSGNADLNTLDLMPYSYAGYIDFLYGAATVPSPLGYTRFAISNYDEAVGIESELTTIDVQNSRLNSTRTRTDDVQDVAEKVTFSWEDSADGYKARIYVQIEGRYYLLTEVDSSDETYTLDQSREEVLATGTVYTGGSLGAQEGIVNGFAYKGWVVWLFKGGDRNVAHSAIGLPETIATGDEVDVDGTLDPNRPATFSLADNFADEPLGGAQAGEACFILGRQGCYSQAGDSPSTMSPPRKTPGSMGCVGKFAFKRFRSDAGEYGVAWLDHSGNVWFAGSSTAFAFDAGARPVELSAPIRGFIRRFLLEEQQAEFASLTDLSTAQMQVDEATGSLWIMLGRRAIVLRPPSLVDGNRQWEAYKFALTSSLDSGEGSSTQEVTTTWRDADGPATSAARTGSTDSWASLTNPLTSDNAYSTASPIDPGDKTELLKVASLKTASPIPSTATLKSIDVRVEHSAGSEGTDTGALHDMIQLTDAGTAIGSNAGTSEQLDTEDRTDSFSFDLTSLSLTPADVNAGDIGVQLGYLSDPPTAYDDANDFSIAIVPTSPDEEHQAGTNVSFVHETVFEITVTYIGGGIAPNFVVLSLYGKAEADTDGGSEGMISYFSQYGDVAVDNGLGDTASDVAPLGDPDHLSADAMAETDPEVKVRVDLTGGVGTYQVTMTSTVNVYGYGRGNSYHTLEAEAIQPDPSLIRVDSVQCRYTYDIPSAGATSGVSWDYAAFSPLRKLWAIRNYGQIDEIEWNSASEAYIEGLGRDGGYEMPAGYWESPEMRGGNLRLSHVGLQKVEPDDAMTITATCDKVPSGKSVSVATGDRWARFGTSQRGFAHRVKIAITEDVEGAEAVDVRLVSLSEDLRG